MAQALPAVRLDVEAVNGRAKLGRSEFTVDDAIDEAVV